MKLEVAQTSSVEHALTNCVFVSIHNYQKLANEVDQNGVILVTLNDEVSYQVRADAALNDSQIALNGQQRQYLRFQLDTPVLLKVSNKKLEKLSSLTLKVGLLRKGMGKKVEIDCSILEEEVKRAYHGHVLRIGQQMAHRYLGSTVISLLVESIFSKEGENVTIPLEGSIVPDSDITFSRNRAEDQGKLQLVGTKVATSSKGVKSARQLVGVDFEKLGIGGLDQEFTQIFRRAFASRIYPPEVVKKLGTKHVRGLMLYGPPGTGKTLIARQLSRVLQGENDDEDESWKFPEPKVVSGPEILNKYVGGSEEKVRELFKEAEVDEKNFGEESGLHVIILDEIDAICKKRGSARDSTGVGDSVVNQLLAKIDGVNSLNNVLLIGMTNRLDIIDPALLRPGRFEVHIEIGLPDEKGRVQILNIHTAKMRAAKVLDQNISIEQLSKETKNFSGAEIEGLVKSAASFAYLRHVNESKSNSDLELKVKRTDFDEALKEIQPAFGVHKEEELEIHFRNGIFIFNEHVTLLKKTVLDLAHQVENSNKTPLLSLLLSGPIGSGKSGFAAKLAADSGFPFVKFVTPDSFIGLSDQAKCNQLVSLFENAYKSPLSMIILDDLERLIDYVRIGPRFSNPVLQALLVLVNKPPPKAGRKLFVIATSSIPLDLQDLGLLDVFNVKLSMPMLNSNDDIIHVVQMVLSDSIDMGDVELIAEETAKPISIKKLLVVLEMCRQKAKDLNNSMVTFPLYMESLHSVKF